MAKIYKNILIILFTVINQLAFSQTPPLYNTFFEDEFYAATLAEKWTISNSSKYTLTKQNGYLHFQQ